MFLFVIMISASIMFERAKQREGSLPSNCTTHLIIQNANFV